jgi:modification methylase
MTTLPLSVWPTAQQSPRAQRYLPVALQHPAKMLPAIARCAISAYSAPGDIVLDPMCGIGTTLVETVHLGRDAVGVEYEPAWAELSEANLAHARREGASGRGEVVCADARHLPGALDPALRGLVALVVTSPPYGPSVHGQVSTRPGAGVHKAHFSYSADPANLAHRRLEELLDGFTKILCGCRALLRAGGIVAVTARPWRERGRLVDLPARIEACAEAAGLVVFERNVALLTGLRAEGLVPRASFFALDEVRRARRDGRPLQVIGHEDVVVLRNPEKSLSSAEVKVLHREPKRPGRSGGPLGASAGGQCETGARVQGRPEASATRIRAPGRTR